MTEHEALQEQAREVERGEAAPWLAFARPEWWQPPMFAAWAGTVVLVLGTDWTGRGLAVLAVVAAPFGFVVWDRRRRAAYPQGPMPRELRRSTGALVALVTGVAAVGIGASLVTSLAVTAVVVAAATVVVVLTYRRLYAADAERVRQRLA